MINDNLKALRKLNKFTQEDVAEKLNVSRQAVSKWESGETVPDIYNCIQLAKLYNIKLDDLVNQEDISDIKPNKKHIFGIVKIDDEGKIIIPKKARKIFNLEKGDKLLLLGDEEQGIALVKTKGFFKFAYDIINSKVINSEDDGEEE